MAKPNYSFEKRQRELNKKKKQEEKRQRKAVDKPEKSSSDVSGGTEAPAPADSAVPQPQA